MVTLLPTFNLLTSKFNVFTAISEDLSLCEPTYSSDKITALINPVRIVSRWFMLQDTCNNTLKDFYKTSL